MGVGWGRKLGKGETWVGGGLLVTELKTTNNKSSYGNMKKILTYTKIYEI